MNQLLTDIVSSTCSQIGHVRYLDKPENVISKETPTAAKKKATPRRGRAKKTADVSLFSDVPMEEFQRDEDKSEESAGEESPDESVDKPAAASTTTPKPSTSAASTSSTRKRRTPAVTREPPPLLERSNKRRR